MTLGILPKITEKDIQSAVKEYLELRGFSLFRRNVGGASNGLHFIRFAEPGQSDLYGWERITGRHIECETKKPGARTNPKRDALQRAWLERVKREGGIALRVKSVKQADEQLEQFGFPRRLLV